MRLSWSLHKDRARFFPVRGLPLSNENCKGVHVMIIIVVNERRDAQKRIFGKLERW